VITYSYHSAPSDYELVKVFLDFDPSVAKSKYVTRIFKTDKKNQ